MLILGGGPALSAFALERLAQRLRDSDRIAKPPRPQYLYLIESETPPEGESLGILEKIGRAHV